MLRVLLAAALALFIGEAEAQTVVNLASPTGNVGMGNDGASHLLALNAMCGAASATLWTACANQVEVNSSGQIAVQAPPSLPLPALAATSTLQSTINTTLGSPFQAGGSVGNTGFNALQAGAANTSGNPFFTSLTGTLPAFASNPTVVLGAGSASVGTVGLNAGSNAIGSLTAGSAIVGKVGIDQTTPGTTNGVQVNAALPAGTNLLGKVGIDQTTPGTTNGVQVNAALPAGTNNIGQVSPTTYPATAVPITASATGTTTATTATLTNVSGHTTYICGFSIRANATAAATGNATVTGTITATMNFTQWTAPLASGIGVTEEAFTPCVPASAVSTSIAVVSAAPGSGGVVSVSAWGYSI